MKENIHLVLANIIITVYLGMALLTIGIYEDALWKAVHSIGAVIAIFILIKMNCGRDKT